MSPQVTSLRMLGTGNHVLATTAARDAMQAHFVRLHGVRSLMEHDEKKLRAEDMYSAVEGNGVEAIRTAVRFGRGNSRRRADSKVYWRPKSVKVSGRLHCQGNGVWA